MKMKKASVTFQKEIAVTLFVPEGMDDDAIQELVDEVAQDGLRAWDDPAWEGWASKPVEITIPDEELKATKPNQYGYRGCVSKTLNQGLVVNDEKTDIVCPEDATWWIVRAEDVVADEHERASRETG